ncbi:lithostathine-like [Saccoglossus kowalevskii]|uniref:Lactose-binding lectin l-2-like n=1 Tax=Saccoglossus kowalevskii TaxID=10224 RepID=A0ABM0MLG9_SACKO|nr:PREDICTED: lactose-binding lectin l-2-like [Saccoglossus kowalevskii]
MKMNVLPIIAFALSINLVLGQELCPSGFRYWSYTGYCYLYVRDLYNFRDADTNCGNLAAGGYLVSTHSLAEEGFVQGLVETGDDYWIGANDVNSNSDFVWTDRSPMDWTNWDCDEPNNSGDEDCVESNFGLDKRWNDAHCDNRKQSVCKAPNNLMVTHKVKTEIAEIKKNDDN